MNAASRLSSRRGLLRAAGLAGAALAAKPLRAAAGPAPVTYRRLPRWRGFNLPDKIYVSHNKPFQESDFDLIAEWGFDFVRLPLDYQNWTPQPDRFSETDLREIDQAVAWGQARGIHVDLCLHRAPGFSVVGRIDALNLWGEGPDGDEARRQFEAQWRMLAERYRGIPSTCLSFNLVNEPPTMSGDLYRRCVGPAIAAVHESDPDRLVIADGVSGNSFCMLPVPELIPLGVAQSLHAYFPKRVTHFRAGWEADDDHTSAPAWPAPNPMNGYLFGAGKRQWNTPLVISGAFRRESEMQIEVELVSAFDHLVVEADGSVIFDQILKADRTGEGNWKRSRHFGPEGAGWYHAIYDRPFVATVPAGTRQLTIGVRDGDWMTFSALRFRPSPIDGADQFEIVPGLMEYGRAQQVFSLDPNGQLRPLSGPPTYGRENLWQDEIEPWARFADSQIGVHVGEFGCNNKTPHDVALAWTKDNLEEFRRAGFGWALWNLRGGYGILDSQRRDVTYEDYRGHKLDRRMLEVLRSG